MDSSSISVMSSISAMKAAQAAYTASVRVMRSALEVQRQSAGSMLDVLEQSPTNKADKDAPTGSNIDILA